MEAKVGSEAAREGENGAVSGEREAFRADVERAYGELVEAALLERRERVRVAELAAGEADWRDGYRVGYADALVRYGGNSRIVAEAVAAYEESRRGERGAGVWCVV
jgi:hypothetical protein